MVSSELGGLARNWSLRGCRGPGISAAATRFVTIGSRPPTLLVLAHPPTISVDGIDEIYFERLSMFILTCYSRTNRLILYGIAAVCP